MGWAEAIQNMRLEERLKEDTEAREIQAMLNRGELELGVDPATGLPIYLPGPANPVHRRAK